VREAALGRECHLPAGAVSGAVLLPARGYALFDLAEAIPGPTTARIGEVARETRTVVIASLFERRAAGLYHNTAVTFHTDGSVASVYRKMHIPDDPLYYEKYYFTPGDRGFQALDTAFGRIGTLVCWDQWYPEGARLTALKGAERCFTRRRSAGIRRRRRSLARRSMMRGRRSSGLTRLRMECMWRGVNRVGHEQGDIRGNKAEGQGIEFWGGSFLADPFGRVIAKASHTDEEILIARDRSCAARRYAAQLAVSARSQD
jgi:N-carbamoylputrescine amidase